MIKKLSFLLIFYSIAFSQIPPSILDKLSANDKKHYLKDNKNISRFDDKEIRNLLQQKEVTKKSIIQRDSVTIIDSAKNIVQKTISDTTTVYEKIIRGDTIYPDSLLNKLSIFGHEMFSRSQPSTFAPTDNISIPSNYIVNIDDEVIILLWGRINEEYNLKVERNGAINIPRIGPVSVAGLTFSAMKENLLARLEQIEGVKASVSIGTMRTIGIFIIGEVKTPGYYTVSALSNITNALFYAGGPTKNGSLRNIHLKRDKVLITTIDLYDFLLHGNDKSSLRLQAGDVIHVPVIQKMVAVSGNVRRPALYELKGNETLDTVLSLAGGITPSAWINTIQIDRFIENNKQIVIDIDTIKSIIPSFPIFDGDIIKVFPILDKNQNTVTLSGNVVRPGKYELKKGMRIADIILDYRSLLPETYLDYAIIIRQDPPKYLNRVQSFNLKNAIDDKFSEDNLYLQSYDHIIIYNLDYFEPDRSVFIDGCVTSPGKYKLLINMKIRDLILQAGGLRDDASKTRGELYRRNLDLKTDFTSTVKIDFCVECVMLNDSLHNITLNRQDRIFIRNKLGWEKEKKINLRGQFKYPGTYVLFEGESLGNLINRAGGYKDDAYLPGAFFTRLSVKEQEQKNIEEYIRQIDEEILNLSSEIVSKENPIEAKAMLDQQIELKKNLSLLKPTGRIVFDLMDSTNLKDFILEDGDELFIPRNSNTVSVIGEVYTPSTFRFNKNYMVSHYIDAAGGTKPNSDNRHIYIIKANGNIITNKKIKILTSYLEPGDAIVVPKKIRYVNPHKIFVDSVDAVFKITSLLATLTTLIIALNRI